MSEKLTFFPIVQSTWQSFVLQNPRKLKRGGYNWLVQHWSRLWETYWWSLGTSKTCTIWWFSQPRPAPAKWLWPADLPRKTIGCPCLQKPARICNERTLYLFHAWLIFNSVSVKSYDQLIYLRKKEGINSSRFQLRIIASVRKRPLPVIWMLLL